MSAIKCVTSVWFRALAYLILFGSGKASPQSSSCRAFQCTASQRYQKWENLPKV